MSQERTSLRRLSRDSLIYGFGSILGRAVSFLMLPIYTRYLLPADYGVLQLLDMAVDISAILFTAGLTAGMSLFYFQTTSEDERNDIVTTAFMLEVSMGLIGAICLFTAAPLVWKYGLRGSGQVLFVRIMAVSFVLSLLSAVPMMLLQLRQRPQVIITINLVRLLAQVSFNILFVVVLKMGVAGILYSGMIVGGVQGVGSVIWLRRSAPGRARMAIVSRLRTFGIPYQISASGSFLLSFGDRFFLQASRGAAAVGLYGLAYQFGFLLYQLSSEQVLRAWGPQRLQLISSPREVRDAKYNHGLAYFNLVLITMATGIGLFVQPVIKIMTTAPFHEAARLVPVILAAYVVTSWGEAVSFGINVSQKTKYITYTTWISVFVVLALYALLIPKYGGMGAAIATLAAFIVRFSLLYYWAQKLWPVSYVWNKTFRLAAYGTVIVAIAFMVPNTTIVNQIALGAVLFATYAALVWATILEPDERSIVTNALQSPGNFLLLFRAGG
jgi:O-antigen/teichoic acid export membrane protein